MEHYTRASFSPTQNVGFMLIRARKQIVTEMDAAFSHLGVTGAQVGILLAMQRGVASTPIELSKRLSVDTGLMTRMLDKLERQGLLERARSADDRRVVNLAMTQKGRQVAAEMPAIAAVVLDAKLKKFTKAEFEELDRLLQKFIGV
ncbi:MarR family winged helix-turn-helix transcriptional regulator [Paraburkholderia pallida]|uniref:MarR family transcriptional regulator n=1 Tax=Paraburkholderia pallida TaxID=2547399 RepID=A0A4P7D2Z7_9BURK|nr:MarR family transcriptional regulator [Paraburkholderia pallida]QBR03066.1 MarR family transcriptional regulator [Paraburkholderia pallida]